MCNNDLVKWLFVAAQVIALVRLLWVRFPYPCFLAALTLWTAQALNVTLVAPLASNPSEWTRTWWRYPEIALIIATTAAVMEALGRSRKHVEDYLNRLLLLISAGALAFVIVLTGICFVAPFHGDDQDRFNQLRAWSWALMALWMVASDLLLTLRGVDRPTDACWHARLLMAVMIGKMLVAPLVAAPDEVWRDARAAYRPLVILACYCWATRFPRRPTVPDRETGHGELPPAQTAHR